LQLAPEGLTITDREADGFTPLPHNASDPPSSKIRKNDDEHKTGFTQIRKNDEHKIRNHWTLCSEPSPPVELAF
jgi:hypothetical protein